MSLRELDWDSEILDTMGIPAAMLPEIRPSSDPAFYGTTLKDGPFGAAVPVCGDLGDQQAAGEERLAGGAYAIAGLIGVERGLSLAEEHLQGQLPVAQLGHCRGGLGGGELYLRTAHDVFFDTSRPGLPVAAPPGSAMTSLE